MPSECTCTTEIAAHLKAETIPLASSNLASCHQADVRSGGHVVPSSHARYRRLLHHHRPFPLTFPSRASYITPLHIRILFRPQTEKYMILPSGQTHKTEVFLPSACRIRNILSSIVMALPFAGYFYNLAAI
jgi:hypothetical protein